MGHRVDIRRKVVSHMESRGFLLFAEEFFRVDLIFRHTRNHTNFIGVEMKSHLKRNTAYATIGECLFHLTKPFYFTNPASFNCDKLKKMIIACPLGTVEDSARRVVNGVAKEFNLPIEILEV